MSEIIPNNSLSIEKIIRIYSEDNNSKIFNNNLKTIIYPSLDSPQYLPFIKILLEQFFKFEKPISKRLLIPVLKCNIELNSLEKSQGRDTLLGSLIFGEYLKYIKCSKFDWQTSFGANIDQLKLSTLSTLLEFPLGIKCIDRNIGETLEFIKNHLNNNSPYGSQEKEFVNKDFVSKRCSEQMSWDPQLGLRALLNLSLKFTARLGRLTIDHECIKMLINCLMDKNLPTDINMLAGNLLSLLDSSSNSSLGVKIQSYVNKLYYLKFNKDFLSWLGYLHGAIHLWKVEYWFQATNNSNLFNFMYLNLIDFNRKLPQYLPSSYLVVGVDLLATLLMRLAQYSKQNEASRILEIPINNIVNQLTTDQAKLAEVLDLIFNLWNHPVEALQYKIKNLLEGLLLLCRSHPNRLKVANDILNRTIRLEYYSKTKYGILTYLLPYLGKPSQCLKQDKEFLDNTFEALKVPLIAGKVGEFLGLYTTLLYKELVHEEGFDLNEFEKIVFPPLVDRLINKAYNFRKPISLYILPKLISLHPQLSHDLLAFVAERSLPASIAVLKVVKSLDLPLPTNLSTLESAIYNADPQVRVDLLGLLCETRKSNSIISASEYSLMIKFLKFNLTGAASDFRQKFTAYFLKFLVRAKDNLNTSNKMLASNRNNRQMESNITEIKRFLSTLIDLIITSFYPGSSPHRISSGLRLLNSFLSTFTWYYEDFFDKINIFKLPEITSSEVLFTTLSYIIMNGYQYNRLLAHDLIKSYPGRLDSSRWDSVGLFNWSFERALSNRARDAESGAHWLDFLIGNVVFSPDYDGSLHLKSKLLQSYIKKDNYSEVIKTTGCNHIDFFMHLLHLLKLRINTAECSITNNESPSISIHGILIILQLMIHQLEKRNLLKMLPNLDIKDQSGIYNLNGWKLVIKEAFNLCHRVLLQVEPPLAQKSPEGIEGDEPDLEVNIESQPESQTQFRNLLSYCWRGCKEASALLGLMLEYLPISVSAEDNGLLTRDQLIKTGIQFQRMFNSLRHRGAFSSVYPNYLKLNVRLLQSKQKDLTSVVNVWLDYHIEQVNCPNLEGTRRSGGLPLGILAILNSFVEVGSGSNEIGTTLDRLIAWAKAGDKETVHRIHAFNVLKFLLTDAKLGPIISSTHTEQAYQLAIDGFGSSEWGIRNSSIMLFTALLNRTFGSKRTRDEHDAVNRLTGREFFGRYPYLLPYLINALELVVEKLESGTHEVPEGLYPILTLLTRLSPSVMDGDSNLIAFKPLVMMCSKSRIYKIREMSSKVLAPLLSGPLFHKNMLELLENLSTVTNENELHGNLLQIEAGLNLNYNSFLSSSKLEITKEFIQVSSELVRLFIDTSIYKNSCNINKGLFLTNVNLLFSPATHNSKLQQVIAEELTQIKLLLNLANLPNTDHSYKFNQLNLKEPLIKLKGPILTLPPLYNWLFDSLQDIRLLGWDEINTRGKLRDYHPVLLDHIFNTEIGYTHYYRVRLIKLLLDNFQNPFIVEGSVVAGYCPNKANWDQGKAWEWSVLRVQKHLPVSLRTSALRLMGNILNNHLLSPPPEFNVTTALATYTALLKDLSHAGKELELRQSVIESLREINLIHFFNNLQESILINFTICLVNLIQDDDENIRINSAELLFNKKVIDDRYHYDKILENLFEFIGDKFATSSSLHNWLWSSISFTQNELDSSFTTIKSYGSRSLFEVESPNQYLEPIKLMQLSYHTLLKIQSKGIETIQFNIKECCLLINNLIFNYKAINNEEFGPLGVSSTDEVFSILSKSILSLKLIQNASSLTNEERLATQTTFEELNRLNEIYPLHPLVLSLLSDKTVNCLKNVNWLTNYLISFSWNK
ncbi:hypothetical protein CONCODRAFT_87570 [Conidiobolus coronatus NRRL 28638]|uniref:Uncharacterized protein n=1 Tax=Conidiobolus coronatus (strain ATCC 28846 / CBS 209.66 / NRRL 28638) TaxID=796925 RepID=A0A137NU52_CONC2|nr:hypothetical protein CONCODRAFT_87570 [Conidiobolus coronatus NRRL 28638]|eukprot:KXN66154.1 hypothetical protein CONCODRAFT_87570 [Conidiobolus coronatus NRRL 28638]